MKLIASLFITLFISGCGSMHVKPESVDSGASQLPTGYATSGTTVATEKWWEDFGSKELNVLVDDVLKSDLSLAQVRARLRQAQASVGITSGSSGPHVNGELGTTHGRERSRKSDDTYDERKVESYSIGIVGSYELDLWGRIAAAEASAESGYKASRWDYESAAMSVVAETTLKWLELSYLRKTLMLLNNQVTTNKKILELTNLRFRRAKATALDVLQRRRTVAQTEALIPPIKSQIALAQHHLSLLLGRPASTITTLKTSDLPTLPVLPETGVPSDLLIKRPDLQAAWERLNAAEWSVAAAKADRLPTLRLTGTWRTSAPDVDQLFRNWLGTLAASLVGPLIDSGRRKAEVERTKAAVDERLAMYRESVLTAFKEVADALSQEKHQASYLAALNKRLEATIATKREAQARYLKGLETYLPVLLATLDQQSLERDMVRARYQQLSYRVQLHRALGGTWTHLLDASKRETEKTSIQDTNDDK